jgi:hypothetical protein
VQAGRLHYQSCTARQRRQPRRGGAVLWTHQKVETTPMPTVGGGTKRDTGLASERPSKDPKFRRPQRIMHPSRDLWKDRSPAAGHLEGWESVHETPALPVVEAAIRQCHGSEAVLPALPWQSRSAVWCGPHCRQRSYTVFFESGSAAALSWRCRFATVLSAAQALHRSGDAAALHSPHRTAGPPLYCRVRFLHRRITPG